MPERRTAYVVDSVPVLEIILPVAKDPVRQVLRLFASHQIDLDTAAEALNEIIGAAECQGFNDALRGWVVGDDCQEPLVGTDLGELVEKLRRFCSEYAWSMENQRLPAYGLGEAEEELYAVARPLVEKEDVHTLDVDLPGW